MGTDRSVERFEREVGKALLEGGVTKGDLLVAAVSGGPDSLALLHALVRLRADTGFELHGAHLDHGLRGEASSEDAAFVADTCGTLGVGFTAGAADVPALRKDSGRSLEEAAREARYKFLARVADEQGARAIVLGHTADDQAETVLMNIIRGSGLTGLRGMAATARRNIAGADVLLLRPLLGLSKLATREYCRALGLRPRLDESNLSREPRRNRVRLELIPLMEELNPAVRDALIRLSRNAAQVAEHLEREVDAVWPDAVRQERDRVRVAKDVFLGLAPAVQTHLLRRAVARVKGGLDGVEQSHVEDMARLLAGPAGRTLDLPGGLRFSAGYAEAIIAPAGLDLFPLPPIEGEHELTVPGETMVGGWQVTARLVAGSEGKAAERARNLGDSGPAGIIRGPDPDGILAHLSFDAVGRRLAVRGRRAGDRFEPLGMAGHKKVQDFMVDSRIPRGLRDRVPLVVSERGIAWIVGWRIAEWAKVGDADETVLRLSFNRTGQPGTGG